MVYDLYYTVQVIVKFYYATKSLFQRYLIRFVDTIKEFLSPILNIVGLDLFNVWATNTFMRKIIDSSQN